MERECPSGLKILLGVLALFWCVVLFLGLWRPDRMVYVGNPGLHPQPWLGRLIVILMFAVSLALLWMAAKARLWAWYILLAWFSYDAVKVVTGFFTKHETLIANLLIDVWALSILIAAISSRRSLDRITRT